MAISPDQIVRCTVSGEKYRATPTEIAAELLCGQFHRQLLPPLFRPETRRLTRRSTAIIIQPPYGYRVALAVNYHRKSPFDSRQLNEALEKQPEGKALIPPMSQWQRYILHPEQLQAAGLGRVERLGERLVASFIGHPGRDLHADYYRRGAISLPDHPEVGQVLTAPNTLPDTQILAAMRFSLADCGSVCGVELGQDREWVATCRTIADHRKFKDVNYSHVPGRSAVLGCFRQFVEDFLSATQYVRGGHNGH